MPFASKGLMRTWLFITIISVTFVNVLGEGDKRFDLKIGFDLTNGADGRPSLRIRDFEDSSEIRQRAKEDVDDIEIKVRADTSSESEEKGAKDESKRKISKEIKDSSAFRSDKDDDDDDDTSDDNRRSTRGLKPGDYEPEDNVKIHNYREDPSDDDSDKLRRRKRFAYFRPKGKSRKKFLRL